MADSPYGLNRLFTAIGILLWTLIYFSQADGLSCFNCFDTYHPRLCRHIGQCKDGEICGLQRHILHNGETRYDQGCFNQQLCQTTGTSGSCTECCNSDLCNVKGCGEHGFSDHRGHICFDCDGVLNASECKTVSVCESGEMCFIEEQQSDWELFYKTSCKSKYICDVINGGGPIIGKKKKRITQKRTITCSKCCGHDLCNTKCGEDENQLTGTHTSTTLQSSSTYTATVSTYPTSKKPSVQEQNKNTFYFAFMTNYNRDEDQKAIIYITSESNGKCTIEAPAVNINISIDVHIGLTTFSFDNNMKLNSSGIENKTIKVTCDVDVNLFGLNREKYSTDGFLVLPYSDLSTQYVVASYSTTLRSDFSSEMTIIATESKTSVTINLGPEVVSYTYKGHKFTAGDIIALTIDLFQTFQIVSVYDLSGTRVQSSTKVAVFSGSQLLYIDGRNFGSHASEMLPPLSKFDNKFIVPTLYQTLAARCRIFASTPASVHIVRKHLDERVLNVSTNSYSEIDCMSGLTISSTSHLMIVLYASKPNNPFMTLIPGIHQYLSNYNIAVPRYYFTSYLTFTTINGTQDDIFVDGQIPKRNDLEYISLNGQQYITFVSPVTSGFHKVYHRKNIPFGLIVNGQVDPDGYGYPAGIKLNR